MATKPVRHAAKRKFLPGEEDSDSGSEAVKKIRKCDLRGCPTTAPICFVRATNLCSGNGYTSRWYHLSAGEHFCNECFEYFYRTSKDGYERYCAWKRLWTQYGKTDNGVRVFMADQMLPYWAQCTLCDRWRQLYRETHLTPRFLRKYKCAIFRKNQTQEQACDIPEDFRVAIAKSGYQWSLVMKAPFFLQQAVYSPYVRSYFQDMVGISPSDTSIHKYIEGITEVRRYLHPFQDSEDASLAMSLPPHVMTIDEQTEFPDFVGSFVVYYLMMRNTAVALWNLTVKKWVTKTRCMHYLIMRGLSRVWLSEHLNSVLFFLTLKGYINHGAADIPKHIDFIPQWDNIQKHPVVIIGGGMAGLAAARQLSNIGVQVTVLEASKHVGGRVVDGGTPAVGASSHMVVGCHNNPVIVMCKQTEALLREMSDNCVLLDEQGERITESMDRRMQFHFEALLDLNRQLRLEEESDTSLQERFDELHRQFKDESGIKFTKLEESLLQFYQGNLEYACGSALRNVSAQNWDTSQDYPQFQGSPILMHDGYAKILEKMADGINIVQDAQVTSVDYTDDVIKLCCANGNQYQAAKVIVSVPLAVLQRETIKFTPPLPEDKKIRLGCGHVEKVILEFGSKFWDEVTKESTMFGRVQMTDAVRGLFDVFYDISRPDNENPALVSYITGDAIKVLQENSDTQIVDTCVQILRKLFPKQEIPEPVKWYVSRWCETEHSLMSYTYIPVNTTAEAFDDLTRHVEHKVYFAGEATHKQFHQTVAGAYMSGLREAENVYRALTDS